MTSSTATLKMLLLGEDRSAGRTLRGVGADADAAHGHIGRLAKGLRTLVGAFLGLEIVSKVGELFRSSFEAAEGMERAQRQTEAVLKSTGHAAHVTADDVARLTESISNHTGVARENVTAGANMLLTFKGIRNEVGKGNDIFNQSTRVVTDMAAAMAGSGSGHGASLKTTAILVGKALNDPIRGLTALRRVGVAFNDQQTAQIKKMVEAGDTMGAQKVILRELNSEFAGSAKAQSTAADRAHNAWHNVQIELGELLLPMVAKLSDLFTKKAAPAMLKFVKQMHDGKGAGGDFRKALEGVGHTLGLIAHVLLEVGGFLVKHRTLVKEAVSVWLAWRIAAVLYNLTQIAALIKLKALTVGTVENTIVTKAATVATGAMTAAQKALALVMRMNPIGLVVTALALLALGLIYAYKHSETFRNIVQGAFHAVSSAASFMWNNVLRPVFRFIVDSFLNVAGAIVHGAAWAFGWVPHLGKKLRHAADSFDHFKARVNHALDGVQRNVTVDAHARVNAAIAAVRALRAWIYSVPRSFRTTYYVNQVNRINKLATGQYSNTQHNATGTAFWRGGLTWMNEEGPELVDVPRGSRIYPASRSAAMIAAAAGAGGGDTALPVTIQLEGYPLWQGLLKVRRTRNGGRPLGIG